MRAQRLAIRLTHAIGLPDDVVLGVPRLLLMGYRELTIENHRGVHDITPELIRVHTRCGTLAVRGVRLTLRYIGRDDLAITGEIASLTYRDGEDA